MKTILILFVIFYLYSSFNFTVIPYKVIEGYQHHLIMEKVNSALQVNSDKKMVNVSGVHPSFVYEPLKEISKEYSVTYLPNLSCFYIFLQGISKKTIEVSIDICKSKYPYECGVFLFDVSKVSKSEFYEILNYNRGNYSDETYNTVIDRIDSIIQ